MFLFSFVAHILFFLPVFSFALDLTGPLGHFFFHAASWKTGFGNLFLGSVCTFLTINGIDVKYYGIDVK
jgi:hypothetical protein